MLKIALIFLVAFLLVFGAFGINLAVCESRADTMKDGERCGIFTIKRSQRDG